MNSKMKKARSIAGTFTLVALLGLSAANLYKMTTKDVNKIDNKKLTEEDLRKEFLRTASNRGTLACTYKGKETFSGEYFNFKGEKNNRMRVNYIDGNELKEKSFKMDKCVAQELKR